MRCDRETSKTAWGAPSIRSISAGPPAKAYGSFAPRSLWKSFTVQQCDPFLWNLENSGNLASDIPDLYL